MKEKIPLNPDILIWARQTAGIPVEEVARRMKKEVNTILSWEQGIDSPTYVQLENLAYKIFKRPLAIFFFPKPPDEESPKQSFRTLPEQEIEMMSSQLKILIRKARVMQINLAELNENSNPAKNKIVQELQFKSDVSVEKMAKQLRDFLGIDLSIQTSWKSTDVAFKEWRRCLESNGVFIFKDAFKDDLFSGFCLYDDEFPLIYINNSKPTTRQIFTLFHELSHLLFGTGGVDTRIDDYINYLSGNERRIEVFCNQFAGQFLVPDSDFDYHIQGIIINDKSILDLSERYNVSREVILRKFLNRNLINQKYYEEKAEKWLKAKKDKKERGGDYYRTKGAYLGQNYLELVFKHYYQNKISTDQLADYLGVKSKNVSGMENLLLHKGSFA